MSYYTTKTIIFTFLTQNAIKKQKITKYDIFGYDNYKQLNVHKSYLNIHELFSYMNNTKIYL